MTKFNLADYGSNAETNSYFNRDLYVLGTLDNRFSNEIDIETLAEKDANYYLHSKDDKKLSGECCIYQQIEAALNIAYNTVEKAGANCVDEAVRISNIHNTDNFKNNIQAEINKIHTTSKTRLVGYFSQYQQKQDELSKCKHDLEVYQKENGLENREPTELPPLKKVRTWALIILIIWAETISNAFLFKSDRGSMLDQSIIALLLSSLNSIFGLLTTKAYVKITTSKRKILPYTLFSIFILLIFSLNLATAHYRNVALTVSSFSEMDRATITSFIENPFQIVGFKTWILFFLGLSCSYFAFLGYFKLTDMYPEFTQMFNHVKNLEQDNQNLMTKYNQIICDLEKEGNDTILKLYSEAKSSLQYSINNLIIRYLRYYNDISRFETHLENLSSQILQDYKTCFFTKLEEKKCTYIQSKNKSQWKLAKKKIHDFSVDLKQIETMQNENYNPTEIEKIYTESRNQLNNLIFSLLTPFNQGEQI